MELTVGVWIPVPKERTANTAKMSHNGLYPRINEIANSSVTTAITASEIMLTYLRL